MMKYFRRFWLLYLVTALVFCAMAIGGNDVVSTIAEAIPLERRYVFVIDAGHGGEDGGAVSCSGVKESGINLDIALRLNDMLHLLGAETVMIRKADVSVHTSGNSIGARKASDLRERVRIVNSMENSILISIHQNYFTQSQYSGAQMFYNDQAGAMELAKSLQDSFVSTINRGSNRQSKEVDGIYLLENIHRPGILVECGFLSNPQEETLLRTGEYQKKICCVIATTLVGLDYQTND